MYFKVLQNFMPYFPQNTSSDMQNQKSHPFEQNYSLWLQNGDLRIKRNNLVEKIESLKAENTKLARKNRYLRQQQQGEYSREKRDYKSRKQMKRYQPKQINLVHTSLQMFFSSQEQYYIGVVLQNSQLQKENQVLAVQNVRLEKQVKGCMKENKLLKKQNSHHHDIIQDEGDYKIIKRTYRPRRQGLIQNISCQYPGCERKYSSSVALRNHERQYHGMMIKVKKEENSFDTIK